MPRNIDIDQLDKEVLYLLNRHIGKDNSIDRWLMVFDLFGERVAHEKQNDDHPLDRAIRASVNRLRKQGHLICDLGNGKGRYLAKDEKEFWEMYSYYATPLKERAEVLRSMKKSALQKWPNVLQPNLFDAFESAEMI